VFRGCSQGQKKGQESLGGLLKKKETGLVSFNITYWSYNLLMTSMEVQEIDYKFSKYFPFWFLASVESRSN